MYTSRRCCSFVSKPVKTCDSDGKRHNREVSAGDEEEDEEEDNLSSFIARRKRKCLRAEAARDEVVDRLPPAHRCARNARDCGKQMAKTKYARHKREACPNR